MYKIIGVTELQRTFRTGMDEVARQKAPYVLTRGSRPEAVLVPNEDFLRFQKFQEEEVLSRFDWLLARLAEQNAAYSEEEVAADVASCSTNSQQINEYVKTALYSLIRFTIRRA